MMKNIFLIGMPASGKSYWAKEIAESLKLRNVDMDELIEKQTHSTISKIFSENGEDFFRIREQVLLKKIIETNTDAIIACGGGTPCFFNNLQTMKQAGKTIYLRTPFNILLKRLQTGNNRPLFQMEKLEQQLKEMLLTRTEIYEQADYILDEENLSLSNFAKIIEHV